MKCGGREVRPCLKHAEKAGLILTSAARTNAIVGGLGVKPYLPRNQHGEHNFASIDAKIGEGLLQKRDLVRRFRIDRCGPIWCSLRCSGGRRGVR